jgi:small subunit ribosomal protein S21
MNPVTFVGVRNRKSEGHATFLLRRDQADLRGLATSTAAAAERRALFPDALSLAAGLSARDLLSALPIVGFSPSERKFIASPNLMVRLANSKQRNGIHVQVLVRDNNVDQALRALKKKMQREGIFREMKMRDFYEKPSQKRAREKAEAVRRVRKLARKRAQREGLVAR